VTSLNARRRRRTTLCPVTSRPVSPLPGAAAGRQRVWRAGRPVDLPATLGPMRRGPGDPTMRMGRGQGGVWRASRTPDGPATLRLVPSGGYAVAATAWGPGAGWVLDGVPGLLGEGDDPAGFEPSHPLLRDSWRRHPGWRVPRSRQVMDALVPAVLEQKVTGREAWRAWRTLVTRFGEPAPGPAGLLPAGLYVPPAPETWRRVPSWDWHRAGVDLSRSRTIVTAAGSGGRLERLPAETITEATRRLRTLPGVGVWTAAEVGQRAFGDADAVSVGDFHLASMVGRALVGYPVDDDSMLELLEPYAGHRYRAVRMIEMAGVRHERHGPRFAGRDYRAM
jgi:3-methyladenine DNA glycosylase/8-oxoguanine DNA glycosylase